MTRRHFSRSALLTCGLLLFIVAVPVVLTWRAWRQEHLNQALITAIKANDTEAVIVDLHAGADPNARERTEAAQSFWERLRRLVMHRHDTDLQGETALDVALAFNFIYNGSAAGFPPSANNARLLNALLEAGADPNLPTGNLHFPGISPLMWAAWTSSPSVVQMLLAHHARVNEQGPDGMTALIYASLGNYGATVTLRLVEHGADVNRQDDRGETALMQAAQDNDEGTMRILLTHHANVNIKDKRGRTALYWARSFRHSNLVPLLKQAGATE